MGRYSKYKGVCYSRKFGGRVNEKPWHAQTTMTDGVHWSGLHRLTEREAALDYDRKMISLGKPPVNILKPKQ
jgi:hypothetical protein